MTITGVPTSLLDTGHVLDTLKQHDIKASFFFTGGYLRKPEHQEYLRRIIAEGHYLGPHSDQHELYCPWDDRTKTLVSEEFFKRDLQKNIDDLRGYGALPKGKIVYFIPPYEWYNADQSRWAGEMGVLLFNFTPGSGSNRDWAPEEHKSFVPSQKIIDDILQFMPERVGARRLVICRTSLVAIERAIKLSQMFSNPLLTRDHAAFLGGNNLGSKLITLARQLLQLCS